MSGTLAGGLKASQTCRKRFGEDFYKKIGQVGGKATGIKKGFASNPELARRAGAIGGSHSRRTNIRNGQGKSRRSLLKYERLCNGQTRSN